MSLEAARFLRDLFEGVDAGALEIACIAPEANRLNPWIRMFWADLPLIIEGDSMAALHGMNAAGYGVYFGVAARRARKDAYHRGTEADATQLTALWVDVDDPTPAALSRLEALTIAMPNVIIRSGGGWHAYWRLHETLVVDDFNRDEIKRTLRGLAERTGGDTSVAELARVMRLPGFANTKPGRGGAMCEIVSTLPGRYHFRQLARAYAVRKRELPAPTRPLPTVTSQLPPWVVAYLENGALEGERNRRCYAAARAYLDAGLPQHQAEADVGARARTDGLPEAEVLRTIQSAYRATPAPAVSSSNRTKMSSADHLARLRGTA